MTMETDARSADMDLVISSTGAIITITLFTISNWWDESC